VGLIPLCFGTHEGTSAYYIRYQRTSVPDHDEKVSELLFIVMINNFHQFRSINIEKCGPLEGARFLLLFSFGSYSLSPGLEALVRPGFVRVGLDPGGSLLGHTFLTHGLSPPFVYLSNHKHLLSRETCPPSIPHVQGPF